MAHFIDTDARKIIANVLVDSRPRFATFKSDGSELWVSSEVGGTVSIIDPIKHQVTKKINFAIPGLRGEVNSACGHQHHQRREDWLCCAWTGEPNSRDRCRYA